MKLTVVLGYYEAKETYGRIVILQSYGNLQRYWTTTSCYSKLEMCREINAFVLIDDSITYCEEIANAR
jgi:hypothetical protein